jgi:hypothetical protein
VTQTYPILEISGDFDDDGQTEDAIFEFPSASVEPRSVTNFLAEFGGGGVAGAVTAQLLGRGEQIAIDGGAGPRTFEIQFEGWTDSDDYQWGTDADAGLSATSATGQDRISQVCVFNEWLHRVDIGSSSPAVLRYGEYASSGVYDPVEVAIPESGLPVPKEESSIYEGSLTCVSVSDINQIIDGIDRTG